MIYYFNEDVPNRNEMKAIMAGSGSGSCNSSAPDCPSHNPCEKCDELGLCTCSRCCLA